MKVIFSFFIVFFQRILAQKCIVPLLTSTSTECIACTADQTLSSTSNVVFQTSPSIFDASNCVNRVPQTTPTKIYVDKQATCTGTCDGTSSKPFISLLDTFKLLSGPVHNKYTRDAEFTIYILSDNYFLKSGDLTTKEIKFFENTQAKITITPLYCSVEQITNCHNDNAKVKIYSNTDEFYFFASGTLTLINLSFDFGDMVIVNTDGKYGDSIPDCNGDLFQTSTSLCNIKGRLVPVPSIANVKQGLFNIVPIPHQTINTKASLIIQDCEFLNVFSLRQNNGYDSFVKFSKNGNIDFKFTNSKLSYFFFTNGIFNQNFKSTLQINTNVVQEISFVPTSKVFIYIENSKLDGFNYYGLVYTNQINLFQMNLLDFNFSISGTVNNNKLSGSSNIFNLDLTQHTSLFQTMQTLQMMGNSGQYYFFVVNCANFVLDYVNIEITNDLQKFFDGSNSQILLRNSKFTSIQPALNLTKPLFHFDLCQSFMIQSTSFLRLNVTSIDYYLILVRTAISGLTASQLIDAQAINTDANGNEIYMAKDFLRMKNVTIGDSVFNFIKNDNYMVLLELDTVTIVNHSILLNIQPFIKIVVEKHILVKELNLTQFWSNRIFTIVEYGRNFTFDGVTIFHSSLNEIFEAYVIALMVSNKPYIRGFIQRINVYNLSLARLPSTSPLEQRENTRLFSFPTYNKGYGIYNLTFTDLRFEEIRDPIDPKSVLEDYIIYFAAGHVMINRAVFINCESISTYRFFSRLGNTNFSVWNSEYNLTKYKFDSVVLVTSSYYIEALSIINVTVAGKADTPIKSASLFEYQALGQFELINGVIQNMNTPKGTSLSLIMNSLLHIKVLNMTFIRNTGTPTMGADLVMEVKQKNVVANNWTAFLTSPVKLGIQDCIFDSSSSSITLLDGGEMLLLNNTFKGQNGTRSPVLTIGAGSNIYMQTFKIQDIFASENGGCFGMSNTNMILKDGTIKNIQSMNKGGVFTLNKQSVIFIENVQISNTKSKYGGVLFSEESIIDIKNSNFNDASAEQEGGHLFLKTSSITIFNLNIIKGAASTAGCIFGRFSDFKVENMVLRECSASLDKGVGNFYLLGLPDQWSNFTNFECSNSISMTGACLIVRNSNIFFKNAKFLNNTSVKQYIFDFSYTSPGQILFQQCTFENNSAYLSIFKSKNSKITLDLIQFTNNLVSAGDSIFQLEMESLGLYLSNCQFYSSKLQTDKSLYQQTFFVQLVGELNFQRIVFEGFKKTSFLKCEQCQKVLIDIGEFQNGYAYNGSVLNFINSQVNITKSNFSDNVALYTGCIATENTNLSVINTFFTNNSAQVEGSDFSTNNFGNLDLTKNFYSTNLTNLTIRNFTQSSIYSVNDVLRLDKVKVELGVKAKGIFYVNPMMASITDSSFKELQNKGTLQVSALNPQQANIQVINTTFNDSINIDSGGFVNAEGNLNLTVKNVTFQNGISQQNGGALVCKGLECQIYLKNNTFKNNKASNIGGSIYSNQRDVFIAGDNIFLNNFAKIGKNVYTFPKSMLVIKDMDLVNKLEGGCIQNGSCQIQDFMGLNTKFYQKSGQDVQFGVMILDHQNNLMQSESEAILEVTVPTNSNYNLSLEGFYSKVTQGISVFKKLVPVGETSKTYNVEVKFRSTDVEIRQGFQIEITACGRGEYYLDSRCVPCPQSFYSLSNKPETDKIKECEKCEFFSQCPGGESLIPDQGYWRANQNSSLILKCLFAEACPKQNESMPFQYVCSSKYKGNVCQNCQINYGSTNKGCILCSDDSLGKFIFFLMLFVSICIMVFECHIAMFVGNNITKSLIRIIFLHNSFWIIITDGGVISSNIADALTSSFSFLNDYFSASPKTIFNFNCFFASYSNTNDIFKANLALQTFMPLILAAIVFLLKILIDFLMKKISLKSQGKHLLYTLFIATIISHRNWYPRLLNSISQMFKCKEIGIKDKKYLTVNTDLECSSDLHKSIIGSLSVPSILIWVIIIPSIITFFILRNKRRGELKREKFTQIMTKNSKKATINPGKPNPSIQNSDTTNNIKDEKITKRDSIFFYLTYDYKRNYYYWYVVEILIVFILSILSQALNEVDYIIKNMVIFVSIAILFLIYQKFQVFDNSLNNNVASLSLGITLFSIVTLLIGANDKTSDIVKQICMVIMILLNMGFFLLCLLLIVFRKAQNFAAKIGTFMTSRKSKSIHQAKVKLAKDEN